VTEITLSFLVRDIEMHPDRKCVRVSNHNWFRFRQEISSNGRILCGFGVPNFLLRCCCVIPETIDEDVVMASMAHTHVQGYYAE